MLLDGTVLWGGQPLVWNPPPLWVDSWLQWGGIKIVWAGAQLDWGSL